MIRQYPEPRLAFSGACHHDKLARHGSHAGNISAILKAMSAGCGTEKEAGVQAASYIRKARLRKY